MPDKEPNPYEILGWAHAYFCCALDEGIDPRKVEVPEIVTKMEDAFGLRRTRKADNHTQYSKLKFT